MARNLANSLKSNNIGCKKPAYYSTFDITKSFEKRIEDFIELWEDLKVLDLASVNLEKSTA